MKKLNEYIVHMQISANATKTKLVVAESEKAVYKKLPSNAMVISIIELK